MTYKGNFVWNQMLCLRLCWPIRGAEEMTTKLTGLSFEIITDRPEECTIN